MEERLRALPSVDEVLSRLDRLRGRFPHQVIVAEIRRVLDQARAAIRSGGHAPSDIEARVEQRLARLASPSLERVINATGVVLHTNLGRAPLARFEPVFGYSNLEYDLAAGKRGKRDTHFSGLHRSAAGKTGNRGE